MFWIKLWRIRIEQQNNDNAVGAGSCLPLQRYLFPIHIWRLEEVDSHRFHAFAMCGEP